MIRLVVIVFVICLTGCATTGAPMSRQATVDEQCSEGSELANWQCFQYYAKHPELSPSLPKYAVVREVRENDAYQAPAPDTSSCAILRLQMIANANMHANAGAIMTHSPQPDVTGFIAAAGC